MIIENYAQESPNPEGVKLITIHAIHSNTYFSSLIIIKGCNDYFHQPNEILGISL